MLMHLLGPAIGVAALVAIDRGGRAQRWSVPARALTALLVSVCCVFAVVAVLQRAGYYG